MKFSELPLAPGGDGFWGHNEGLRADKLELFDAIAARPEPLFRLRLPFPFAHAVLVNSPEAVGEVLVEKVRAFGKGFMLRFSIYPIAGEGLFTSDGDLWRRQRKKMAPLFTPMALADYAADMVDCTERVMRSWQEGQELRLHHETTAMTMSIAGKTLFDSDTLTDADELGQALTTALQWSGQAGGSGLSIAQAYAKRACDLAQPLVPGPPRAALHWISDHLHGPVILAGKEGRAVRRALELLEARVETMIAERRARPERHDLLARLLDAAGEPDARGDRQIRDEILTLFVAGHETTAAGLAWALYLLGRHPQIMRAVQDEVDRLPGPPTVADLPQLSLCLQVFLEALRLYPPVFVVSRQPQDPVTISGCELPALTNTLIPIWSIHRNPHVWQQPLAFMPERFAPGGEASRRRHAYLPFGAGPRICIGNHFAQMEAQLVLATILRAYRFTFLQDEVPEAHATLRPKHGVRVRVHAREVT